MADQKHRGAGFLGIAHQPRCALAHLAHRARRCGQRLGPQGLYRIGHDQLRPGHAGVLQDVFDAGFGQGVQAFQRQIQAHRAPGHLGQRFLAGHIQHRQRGGHARQRLQQQRRLADPWVAADQHHRPFHQPATQHPIELADTGGDARLLGLLHVLERSDLGCLGLAGPAATPRCRWRCLAARGGAFEHDFAQRVPDTAFGALPLPLGVLGTALAADIGRFRLRHRSCPSLLKQQDSG